MRLDTTSLSGPESFDYWHETVRGAYELSHDVFSRIGIRISVDMWPAGDLLVSDVRASRSIKWRSAAQIRRDGRQYIKVRRYLSGRATLVSDGQAYDLLPGATYLLNQSRPFTEVSQDNHQLNVFVPADELGVDLLQAPPMERWGDDTDRGAILAAAFEVLFSEARQASFVGAADRADAFFTDVLRTLMSGGTDSALETPVLRARQKALHKVLDARLSDPNLTVDGLLSVLPMSRSNLYRIVEDEGGVARYVRRRRLGRAYEALSRSRETSGAVTRTADLVGYGSVHSFHKAFKREFGVAPGDILGSRSADARAEAAATVGGTSADPASRAFLRAFEQFRAVR